VVRSRPALLGALVLALSLALVGCTSETTPTGSRPGANGDDVAGPGRGSFTLPASDASGGEPVTVWYSAPAGGAAGAEILIVLHGTGRDGEDYLDDWVPLVRGRDVLVLAPEFSDEQFPGSQGYNLGNVADGDGDLRPEREWSFQVVEDLFDHVRDDVGSDQEGYDMYGHSAGAQFVHRFLTLMPRSRVNRAVAANAGWYTELDDSIPFPYGLQDSPAREAEMEDVVSHDLTILLGADDTDSTDDDLRRDDLSDEQGINRLERGVNFYLTAREMASERSFDFDWSLVVQPGVGHSHEDMAAAAAPLLLG